MAVLGSQVDPVPEALIVHAAAEVAVHQARAALRVVCAELAQRCVGGPLEHIVEHTARCRIAAQHAGDTFQYFDRLLVLQPDRHVVGDRQAVAAEVQLLIQVKPTHLDVLDVAERVVVVSDRGLVADRPGQAVHAAVL